MTTEILTRLDTDLSDLTQLLVVQYDVCPFSPADILGTSTLARSWNRWTRNGHQDVRDVPLVGEQLFAENITNMRIVDHIWIEQFGVNYIYNVWRLIKSEQEKDMMNLCHLRESFTLLGGTI